MGVLTRFEIYTRQGLVSIGQPFTYLGKIDFMAAALKQGALEKWSDTQKNFHYAYGKLLSNGLFQWFDSEHSVSPKHSIDIKTVSAFLAFGPVINQIPSKPVGLLEQDIDRCFGIPHESHQQTKVSFFRCPNQSEMGSWMNVVNQFLFGNIDSSVVAKQAGPLSSGIYDPYGPPPGAFPPPPSNIGQTAVSPPLPVGFASFPGMPPATAYPPQPVPTGYPYQPPMAPPPNYNPASIYNPPMPAYNPAASYQTPPPPQLRPSYGVPGPSNNYAPQQPNYSNSYQLPQGQPQQPYMVDKNGKPYTIVYKDGKPKKKKWKKAALGLAAGAASGYIAGKMFGGLGRSLGYGMGGWGGGWGRPHFGGGFGHYGGSWSSLSSFSSGGWSS